ncbi:hypothetical protein BV22DRAFT_1033710 [Leucogyrophana mollusca]|uniref:Uncharacterized protein n=1 Tax=Leucogyrophana mollusca TaxID=85980 RepID=A0ACB8BKB9_9AGAM|nr:hypothetical protein BV22DRAFT_1033710 [Leucogyrophana mollusca]
MSETDEMALAEAWIDKIDARIADLNRDPQHGVFEVRESGNLVAGDLVLCKGEGDSFDADMGGIKPGIWKLVAQDEDEVYLAWVGQGPLPDDLSLVTSLQPSNREETEWQKIGSFSVDSGSSGILDWDTVAEFDDEAGVGREVAMESLMDPNCKLEDRGHAFVVPGGIIIGGNDGGYRIYGRGDDDGIFEIKVTLA